MAKEVVMTTNIMEGIEPQAPAEAWMRPRAGIMVEALALHVSQLIYSSETLRKAEDATAAR